jgi:hypothetical protein
LPSSENLIFIIIIIIIVIIPTKYKNQILEAAGILIALVYVGYIVANNFQ